MRPMTKTTPWFGKGLPGVQHPARRGEPATGRCASSCTHPAVRSSAASPAPPYWDWFYVDLFWLREDVRGQGHGHRLIELAENEARKRGASRVYLDTFSFQAPDFYRDHGDQVFGELPDFLAGIGATSSRRRSERNSFMPFPPSRTWGTVTRTPKAGT